MIYVKKNLKRGHIVTARFHGLGCEQRGVRPAIIVQNDKGNKYSKTTIVIPLTKLSGKRLLPTHQIIKKEFIGQNAADSIALTEQIRVIDRSRIKNSIGKVPDTVLQRLEKKILIA